MLDKKDQILFLKVFFGDKPDIIERYNNLRKTLDIGFLNRILEDNPNSHQIDIDLGEYELDVFEEKGETVCLVRVENTLYYITKGSAVEISESGMFTQIDLNKFASGITSYTMYERRREGGLVVQCQMATTDCNTRFKTVVPCNAKEVLGKLQLKNLTVDQLVQFIKENTNQDLSNFKQETSFTASHGFKRVSLYDTIAARRPSFKYFADRYSAGESLGDSLGDAYKNIQPYLNNHF